MKITNEFRVETSWKVKAIEGINFDPTELNYKGEVPKSTTFVVYQFKMTNKQYANRDYRLYLCKEKNCDRIVSSLSKIYDHIRSHSKERPFMCPYNCGRGFT